MKSKILFQKLPKIMPKILEFQNCISKNRVLKISETQLGYHVSLKNKNLRKK